jgi:hypothetical protein
MDKRTKKLIDLAQEDEQKFREELEKIQDIEEAPTLKVSMRRLRS